MLLCKFSPGLLFNVSHGKNYVLFMFVTNDIHATEKLDTGETFAIVNNDNCIFTLADDREIAAIALWQFDDYKNHTRSKQQGCIPA